MSDLYIKRKVEMLKENYDQIGAYDLTVDLILDGLVEDDEDGKKEAKVLCDLYFKRNCDWVEIKEAFNDTNN